MWSGESERFPSKQHVPLGLPRNLLQRIKAERCFVREGSIAFARNVGAHNVAVIGFREVVARGSGCLSGSTSRT